MAFVGLEIPFAVFGLFLGLSVVMAIFGFARKPQVPILLTISGIVMISLVLLVSNITMSYSNVNSQRIINQNTTIMLSNSTVFDVSQYYTTDQSYTGHDVFSGEYFNSSSFAIGKSFSCMTIAMKKVGNPTGIAYFGILDTTNKGTMKKIIGSIDVAQTFGQAGFRPITLCAGSVTQSSTGLGSANGVFGSGFDKYTILAGDKIGMFYNDGNSTNYIATANSRYKDFDSTGDPTCATHHYSIKVNLPDVNSPPFYSWGSCFDITMQLIYTNSVTSATYHYDTAPIPIDFPFDNWTKTLFAMLGALFILISVGMVMKENDKY